MRVSSDVIRIKRAAACKCSNRVTQNSSSRVVHQLVGFSTHEDRNSVSFQGMSCFHYKPMNQVLKNREFRKNLQIIPVIKFVCTFRQVWDFVLQWRYILEEIINLITTYRKVLSILFFFVCFDKKSNFLWSRRWHIIGSLHIHNILWRPEETCRLHAC
jgi:hypothetical protein